MPLSGQRTSGSGHQKCPHHLLTNEEWSSRPYVFVGLYGVNSSIQLFINIHKQEAGCSVGPTSRCHFLTVVRTKGRKQSNRKPQCTSQVVVGEKAGNGWGLVRPGRAEWKQFSWFGVMTALRVGETMSDQTVARSDKRASS